MSINCPPGSPCDQYNKVLKNLTPPGPNFPGIGTPTSFYNSLIAEGCFNPDPYANFPCSAITSCLSADTFVTGGTFTSPTLTLTRNDGVTIDISGFASGGGTFTGNTSATCINELWVSTISGCSPVIIGPSVGIGTTRPSAPIEVKDYIKFNPTRGNTFYGQASGAYAADNASTQYNTGIGKWALGAFNVYGELDGATYNVAVGGLSQAYRTTGDYNTSVGQASMQSHTTSSWNTSVGYQAGMGVVDSGVGGNNYNTSIGANAGWYQTGQSGEDTYNTAVGYSSMYTSLGFYTTSIGALSQGSFFAPAGCNACTSVGYKTLYNAGTGGIGAEYNIAIGYQAGDNITLGSHNICIGNDADPPSPTGDYQMNIGDIIYGRDFDGSSSINTVGIGTSAPNKELTVSGSISATTDLYVGGNLNVTTVGDGTSLYNLGMDSAGFVVTGVTGGGGNLLVASTLYVDGTNGDDATAVSGDMSKPYATITAAAGANSVAGVGDTVHVRPGTYVENDILKDGVTYYFDKGAIFHPTAAQQNTDNKAILTAEAYTYKVIVLGYGEFISDYAAGGISNACIRIVSDEAYLEFFQCTWTGGSASGGQKSVVYLNATSSDFEKIIELNGNVTKTTDTGGSGGNGWYAVYLFGGYNYKINGVFSNLSNANNSTGIKIEGGSYQNIQCTGRIFVKATTATCYGFRSTNNYTTFSWDGDIEIETQANGYAMYADTGYSGECLGKGTFRGAIYCGMGGLEGRGMYISGLQIVSASPSGYAFQLVDDAYVVVDLVISSSIAVFNVTFGALLFQGCATIHSNNMKFLTQTGGKFIFNGMMENIARRLTNSTITGGECVIQSDFIHWGSNYPSNEYLFYVDGGTLRVEGCRLENSQTTNGSGVIEYVSGNLILNGAVLVSTAVDPTTFSIKVISALNYIGYNDSYANMVAGGGGSLTNIITNGGSLYIDADVE